MKLQIAAGELLRALNIVNHVRVGRTTLPILNCVLMRAESQSLVLSRTNLNLSITTRVSVDSKADDSVLAPAAELTQLCSRLPADHQIQIDTSTDQISITSKSGKHQFATIPVDDFPRIRTHICDGEIALDGERFSRTVNRVAFCVSTDMSRPALCGVVWSTDNMAATDGHRLARQETDLRQTIKTKVIVPPDTLTSVATIVKGAEQFFVAFGEKHITFRAGDTEIASNLIEGPYPDINQVIPKETNIVVLVDRQELIESLDRLEIAANDLTRQVSFAITDRRIKSVRQLLLSCETADSGKKADESLNCELTGEPIEIGFNLLYLLEILKRIETQKVRIEFTTPDSAAIFRPINVSEYFYLLMPLRLT